MTHLLGFCYIRTHIEGGMGLRGLGMSSVEALAVLFPAFPAPHLGAFRVSKVEKKRG